MRVWHALGYIVLVIGVANCIGDIVHWPGLWTFIAQGPVNLIIGAYLASLPRKRQAPPGEQRGGQ